LKHYCINVRPKGSPYRPGM